MNILRVHPFLRSERFYPYAGGMARTSLRLTEELVRAGHRLFVFPFPDLIGTSTLWDLGGGLSVGVKPTVVWPGWRRVGSWVLRARDLQPRPVGLRGSMLDAMTMAALDGVVSEFRPHVIHNHLSRRGFPRLYQATELRVPLVLTHHHFEAGESLQSYDRIVFVSRSQRERIRRSVTLSDESTRVVYNPVAEEFRQGGVLPTPDRSGFVFSSALIRHKGIDLVVKAFAGHPQLRVQELFLCGEGSLESDLETLVRKEGLRVHLLGKLSREELRSRLARARVMVLPSRGEGWSAAINEAVCCGTPVVAYAPQVEELRDLLGLEVGVPFDAFLRSPADLADCLLQALESPLQDLAARQRMAVAAREALSGEKFARGYEEVYRELAT
jgi:glycosyltransferase involved in cell wall biosynthesis